MADLYAAGYGQGLTAPGATLAGLDFGDVGYGVGAEIAGVVGVQEVGVGLVGADHEVVAELYGVVGDTFQVSPTDR